MSRYSFVDFVDILRVNAFQPLLWAVCDLSLLITEHGLPATREIDLVGFQIPIPQSVVGTTSGQGVTFLAPPERFLGTRKFLGTLFGSSTSLGHTFF